MSAFVVYNTDVRVAVQAGRALALENRLGSRSHPGPQAARRIATRPGRGRQRPRWPCGAKCSAMSAFARPTSSTLLAPSLPLQLLKVALRNLWSAAPPELLQERGPGIAHGSPRSPRDQPVPRAGRKVCIEFQHHCRPPAKYLALPGPPCRLWSLPTSSRRNGEVGLAGGAEGPG